MQKRKLHLDREIVTSMVSPVNTRAGVHDVDGASIPTTPTSIWSIVISILSIVTLPPKTDPTDSE